MPLLSSLRKHLCSISASEATIRKRGFHVTNAAAADRLERIGAEFIAGYNAALELPLAEGLSLRLNHAVELEYRGFAYEGAAMALMLTDRLHLTSRAFDRLLQGAGAPHTYMLHVGAGWAWARLPWLRSRIPQSLRKLDPLLGWLALDGYGFHEGYFHWPKAVRRKLVPTALNGYERRAFDQGLGRSLWFVEGMSPLRVTNTIAEFPQPRQDDLWSGVGLACAYAGGAAPSGLELLRRAAGLSAPSLAQGCAFACGARHRAGNPADHTGLAARILCGVTADAAAAMTQEESFGLPPDGDAPAYEVWRRRLRHRFAMVANPGSQKETSLGLSIRA
jgi:enediyne biosynthesis protein E3